MKHPRDVLLGPQAAAVAAVLPVCDHYSGTEVRMRKSLQLQAEMTQEFGACVFDVTLDCEDGAAVGGELDHAQLVAALALGTPEQARVGVRVHAIEHAAFEQDVQTIVGQAAAKLRYLMVPKVDTLEQIEKIDHILKCMGGAAAALPLHVLVESSLAVQHAFAMAAHPRVQSLSFGLMDFVSSHHGAIPASAMSATGQFSHPLVVRAKLDIAAACHAHGKTPSHCIVTELNDPAAFSLAASRAAQEYGYTRMWSIHPQQIRPILAALAPPLDLVEFACDLIATAQESHWAPVRFHGKIHDRASYRFYWQVITRAHQTGQALPVHAQKYFNTVEAYTQGQF